MFELMNELSELIYITDLDNYDLLYMNRAGKQMFGVPDITGLKCYRVLQGKDRPCEMCTNDRLQWEGFYTWEYTNPRIHRHYLLKDKFIDWNGKKARVEVAFDMTESENKKQELKNALDAENLVNACAKLLYGADEAESAMDRVLAMIGGFLEAERAYLFEFDGTEMSNTHEWCAPSAASQRAGLQKMPSALIARWQARFQKQQCVIIQDLEDLRDTSPAEYAVLKRQGIHSLISAPMMLEGQLIGFLGVDNYATHKLSNAPSILSAISYFFGALLRLHSTMNALERLSCYDALTGVRNRNGYMLDLEDFNGQKAVGAVYMDINGMKQINDREGHRRGDEILLDASQKILSLFAADTIYRIGGDEFVVLCQGMEKEEFAGRVRDLVNLFKAAPKYSIAVGAHWTECCGDIQNVIYQADESMYEDKKKFYHGHALSGRYRPSMDESLEMTKPGVLTEMIEKGCFVIYFQPKVGVADQEVIGSEALVRCWPAPGKLLQPGQFIPVLEAARLISKLDFYMFDQVCAQIEAWLAQGRGVTPVSVNFSRYTISEDDFAGRLQQAWEKRRIPKHLVEIEVTETVEAEDNYTFIEVMKRVKRNGFAVSIDDFGVRHANLSLFTSLEFDVLKIDKSLVDDLPVNRKAQAILSSIAEICRKMEIRLIVEGVETPEQMDFLRTIYCDGVQGYLFSKPIPVEEFQDRYLPAPGR